jgi:hypothetical protein
VTQPWRSGAAIRCTAPLLAVVAIALLVALPSAVLLVTPLSSGGPAPTSPSLSVTSVGSVPSPATPAGHRTAALEPSRPGSVLGSVAGLSLPSPANPRLTGAPLGPLLSDPSNPELDNLSSTTSVAQVGASDQSVVVGAEDLTTFESQSGFFFSHGVSASFRTVDGGLSWSEGWLGQNTNWSTASNWAYGDISFGQPSLAGGPNGTVLYASIYAQPCSIYNTPCNSTRNATAPAGIAVARSTNSGVSWSPPVAVTNQSMLKWFGIFCGTGTGRLFYEGDLPANQSDKPSVAYASATGVAIVGWEILSYSLSLECQGGVGVYVINSVTLSAEVAVSLDNGVSWSAPQTIGRINTGAPAVAIGPAPTYALSVVYNDYYNGSATFHSIAYSQSIDHGAKWSKPVDIGAATLVHPNNGTAPDAFVVPTIPSYAVDNWSDSSYRGTEYVVWGDNRTAAADGSPSVVLVRSAAGSGTWSGTTVLDAASSGTDYFEPTVTVGPEGRVWVVFYELDRINGAYQLFGQYSTDGGASWTQPFAVADTPSYPGTSVFSIGSWVGAAATSAGLYSAWTDCRWAGCAANDVTAVYAALSEPVSVDSGLPAVVATVSASGGYVSSAVPLESAWDNGAAVTVSVPSWVPLSNTTRWVGFFSNYSGIASSSSDSVFFDYGGGSVLNANYATAPAAWISGWISPANANPTVTVDGSPVPVTPFNSTAVAFNDTVASGVTFTLVVSAAEYDTYTAQVPTTEFHAGPGTIDLARSGGWIRGRLTSTGPATITVNGTVVTDVDPSSGVYNVTEGWGSYWVNATGAGLDSFSQYVTVAPHHSAVVDIALIGGWIDGSVAPGNATVRIDGVAVSVSGGSFNVSVLGGTHTVTATILGYSSFRTSIVVSPTRTVFVPISITDFGTVRGTVSPVTASVLVAGSLVPVVSGSFEVGVKGGPVYNVTVTAPGFLNGYANVPVTPANVSYANFTLTAVPACTTSCGGGGSPGVGPSPTSAPFSWLDVAIAAVVILGVALVIAVVLVRSSGGRGGTPPPDEDPAAPAEPMYGEDGSGPAWEPPNDPAEGTESPP